MKKIFIFSLLLLSSFFIMFDSTVNAKLNSNDILRLIPTMSIVSRYYNDPETGYYAIIQPMLRFKYNITKKIKVGVDLKSPRYNVGGWMSYREKFDARSTPWDLMLPFAKPTTNYNNVLALEGWSFSIDNGLPFASQIVAGDLWINLSPYFASDGYNYSGLNFKKELDEVHGFEYDGFLAYDKIGNYFFVGQYIPFIHEGFIVTFRSTIGEQFVNKSKYINEKVRSSDMYAFNASLNYNYDKKTPGIRFYSDYTKLYENDYASAVLDSVQSKYYVNGPVSSSPIFSDKNLLHLKFLFKPGYLFWSTGIEYSYLDSGLKSLQYTKALLSWMSSDFPEPPNKLYSEFHHVGTSFEQINYEKYNNYFDDQQGFDIFLQYKFFNYFWVKGSTHLFHDISYAQSFNHRYLVEVGTSLFQGVILKNWTGLNQGGVHQNFADDILYKNEKFNETGLFLMPFNFLSIDLAYKIFQDDKRVEYPDVNQVLYAYVNINFPFFPELSLSGVYKYTKFNVVEPDSEITYTKGGYYIDESDYFPDNFYRIDLKFTTFFTE